MQPLIEIAQQGLPFSAIDGQVFVRLPGPRKSFYILPLRSPAYRHWFFHEFFSRYATLPGSHAFHAILHHLEAEVHSDPANQRLTVFRRIASRNGALVPDHILVDLANSLCQFVEISLGGWQVTAGEGVLFQTSRSMGALPEPVLPTADHNPLDTLRACLNLPSRAAWLRCLAWLLAAFRPNGPFPILILQGPPGSGKSTAARILRALVDPSTTPLTPIPASVRDLVTLARNNWVLAFDHLSSLSPPLTDALCRISSGLGASFRELPGHVPEPLQQTYKRPVLLTVTERWSCPPALAERALTVTLPPLSPGSVRTEDRLLTEFNAAWPAISGALCTAIGAALSRVSDVGQVSGPCPNALAWAMAASPALGSTPDEMQQAFGAPVAPHPMVEAVRNLLDQRRHWTGTASELLDLLQPLVPASTPKGISQGLRKCMLTLADSGIELKFRRLHEGTRIIDLRDDPGDASFESPLQDASPDSAPHPQPEETAELTAQ